MASVSVIPLDAFAWLAGPDRAHVLLVGASPGHVSMLVNAGHVVTVVDQDPRAVSLLRLLYPDISVVVAAPEALPFDPGYFQTVLSVQNFHCFAPGLALAEWARVLRLGGRVSLAYLLRDDSIPWVKKLRVIIQTYLPEAMTSQYGAQSVSSLRSSPYFPFVEEVSFRLWVPCTRSQLQENAQQAEGAAQLDPVRRTAMLDEVGQLYDQYARAPDPLQLPYRISCWRAIVDQSMLTDVLGVEDDGLTIDI